MTKYKKRYILAVGHPEIADDHKAQYRLIAEATIEFIGRDIKKCQACACGIGFRDATKQWLGK